MLRAVAATLAVVASLAVPPPGVLGSPQPAADGIGVVDPLTGRWYLRDPASGATTSFFFGNPGDVPIVGDWDCDGVDTPGQYRPSDGVVYLRNSNTQGNADLAFPVGRPGDIPLAGDFDGDGCDTVSLYRPSTSRVFIVNELGTVAGAQGEADHDFRFGAAGDLPFVGDFDGDGVDTVGRYRASTGLVYLSDGTRGFAGREFAYGDPGDVVLAGTWAAGTGAASVASFRPAEGTFYLRFTNTPGNADRAYGYAAPGMIPVAGNFGPLPGGDAPPGLDVLPRSAWDARPADTAKLHKHTIRQITIHHAGDQSDDTGPPRFRSWQDLHQGRGWGDLAYHAIIGVDGTIYEGRAVAFAGDTGTSYDPAGHFLIVLEGNFDVDYPTRAQLDSLVKVAAWASTAFDVSPATISGHRDHANTACPGDHLYPYIASGGLQRDVEAYLAAGSA